MGVQQTHVSLSLWVLYCVASASLVSMLLYPKFNLCEHCGQIAGINNLLLQAY